jgi:hypothetical protein
MPALGRLGLELFTWTVLATPDPASPTSVRPTFSCLLNQSLSCLGLLGSGPAPTVPLGLWAPSLAKALAGGTPGALSLSSLTFTSLAQG